MMTAQSERRQLRPSADGDATKPPASEVGLLADSMSNPVDTARDTSGPSKQRRLLAVFAVCVTRSSTMAAITLFIPFIALEALEKSPDRTSVQHHTEIGLVFGIYKLMDALLPPLVSMELPKIGPRNLVILGEVLLGGSVILFAFVSEIADWPTFLGFCCALRAVQGVGAVTVAMSVFALLIGFFPESPGRMNGLFVGCAGFGTSWGPLLGAFVYEAGGFRLPFLVIGCFLLAQCLMLAVILPADQPDKKEIVKQPRPGILKMLREPWVWIQLVNSFLSNFHFGAIVATAPQYFHRQFNARPSVSGLLFFSHGIELTLSSFLIGLAIDHNWNKTGLEILGCLLTAAAGVLAGPVAFLQIRPSLVASFLSMLLLSVGNAFLYTVPSPHIFEVLEARGYGSAVDLRFSVAGLDRPALSLGYCAGALAGPTLTATLGFGKAFAVISVVYFGQAAVLSVAGLVTWLLSKQKDGGWCGRRKEGHESSDVELAEMTSLSG